MKWHIIAVLLPIPFLMGNKGGCWSEPPDPMISTKLAMITPPHECLSSDPAWSNPPDADEPRSETARRERKNKDSFNAIRSDRSVCRAGLKAIQKQASKD